MMLFDDKYEGGGRKPLGNLKGNTCRDGYCLELQRKTGQTRCAYCGVSLVHNYYHWLLITVDHVVTGPLAEKLFLKDTKYFEDYTNLVLACSGCNGFDNKYEGDEELLEQFKKKSSDEWNDEDFYRLRDIVFEKRKKRIAECRTKAMWFFDGKPWEKTR